VLDTRGELSLDEQVAWLGRVLQAREFPIDRLARNLELAAEVAGHALGEDAVASALRGAATMVRDRESFLD
jgi:hypothetical protein